MKKMILFAILILSSAVFASHEIQIPYTTDAADVYACIFKNDAGTIKVNINGGNTWEVWNASNIDTYDVAMSEVGHCLYTCNFPATITAAGWYTVMVYAGDKNSSDDDIYVGADDLYWSGSAECRLVTNATGQVTVGTNVDKTGYSLTQTFPINFEDLAITDTTGQVTVGTNADKTGYGLADDAITAAKIAAGAITSSEAPNLDAAITTRSSHSAADAGSAAATAMLTTPANKLTTDADGNISIATNGIDQSQLSPTVRAYWLTAEEVRSAVWDALVASYDNAGSFGELVDSILTWLRADSAINVSDPNQYTEVIKEEGTVNVLSTKNLKDINGDPVDSPATIIFEKEKAE